MPTGARRYADTGSYWIFLTLGVAVAASGWATGEEKLIAAGLGTLVVGWPLSKLISGIRKRRIFSAKKKEIKTFHSTLVEETKTASEAAAAPVTIALIRQDLPQDEPPPFNRIIRDDLAAMVQNGVPPRKDFYLFLRSLRIAGSICYYNETRDRLLGFDEMLADAIDTDATRMVGCVGNGGEYWTAAQIHFDTDWKRGIVPFFKSSVCIISMPGCTPACLEESALIRSRPELLEKTVFVLPPLSCYRPPLGSKRSALNETFGSFQKRMTQIHRDKIGLHFPPPEEDRGYFVTMDHKSGHVLQARPWKTVNLTITYTSGRPPVRMSFPSLNHDDVRAAAGLVLRRRGFI